MAQVTVETTGVAEDEDTYTVQWTATTSVGMPEEIFVFSFATRAYSHVAHASDLQYPTSPSEDKGFYRQASAEKSYDSIEQAEKAKINVSAAVQRLVDDFNDNLVAFESTSSTTYL